MQIHVVECEAAPTVSPILIALRTQLTTLTFPSPYLSDEEKLRANHHVHECEDMQRLGVWLRNVPAELARREAAYYGLDGPCSVKGRQLHILNRPSQEATLRGIYPPCSVDGHPSQSLNACSPTLS